MSENDFIQKITEIIENNISNERFGVSELADKIGMSRSNLLRKVQKLTNQSVSQFIRNIRLKHAMELFQNSSANISEISYQVGFSSTSYFIKCFREYYGYPPGEAGKKGHAEKVPQVNKMPINRKKIIIPISVVIILIIGYLAIYKPLISKKNEVRKSIAVLPFHNDSNDSSNVYFINGLMESVLSNLQKINDLNVISRTSVEKYRNTEKSIKEIGKELDVCYIIEGSGQKVGDKILLNIQLIDTEKDRHLWAEQYRGETEDVFQLQIDVAKNIAGEIEVIITPEEEKRIDKIPTNNLVAYDYYLKGLDYFNRGGQYLLQAKQLYQRATEHDPEFAVAYAGLAKTYYYIDLLRLAKVHADTLDYYADKALALDPELDQSLVSKALSFMNKGEKFKALPYFEKALEYNPNSAEALNYLSDYYARYNPNTAKYLEYALKGAQLDVASQDSTTLSYIYLHLSNALIQSGFIEEAKLYINKSLDYNPENIFSEYVKAYILYAKNNNLKQTKELLIETLKKDTTRLDVLQEVAKICYYMRDYESSYYFYKKFVDAKETYHLSMYPSENGKISVVYAKMGMQEKSEELLNDFYNFAEQDQSIYRNLNKAMYYSVKGDTKKAIEYLDLFSNEDNYFYWLIVFLDQDPMVDNIRNLSEYKKIRDKLVDKFWNYHRSIKTSLEAKKLI